MKREDITSITARCFHGDPASCSHPCPFFFDVRTFLARAAAGKWGLAYKLYRNAVVFPAIICEICGAPCRTECQREDDAVDIRAVEAAAVRFAKDRRPETFRIPPKTQRIAVVGAGLAGLSLALNMAQKAYPVTIFERGAQGLISWASHPKYESFPEEIRLQFSSVDAEFAYGREIKGPDDPALEGFDAVYIAIGDAVFGATAPYGSAIPGSDGPENENKPVLSDRKYFAGGGFIGQDAVTAIAYGIEASKEIEAWLQTGERISFAEERPEKHYLDHEGEPARPVVVAADPLTGYTKEEAGMEASRCMGCDCRACMDACEMLGLYNKRPQKIAIEAFSDIKTAPPFSSCTLTRETYSCNLCSRCKTVCPVGIDMKTVFHLARAGRALTGKYPRAFHDFWLSDFDWHRKEGAYFTPPGHFGESKAGKRAMLFFPGCKLGARSPGQVKAAAEFLKEQFDAGLMLDCCGAPAYWAGEETLFLSHIESIQKKCESAGSPVFVFACAYCMRLFGDFLPEIEKLSLYELLAEAGTVPAAAAAGGSETLFSVFDPCMARGFPEMEKAVRKLAENLGLTLTELTEKNHCCGYGGHMRVANPELYDTITEHRSSAGEAPYMVYCANCAGSFILSGKEHAHILDLVFPAGEEVFTVNTNTLQQWRNNAAAAKAAVAGLYGAVIPPPVKKPRDGFDLGIPPKVVSEMDRRLILEDDLREAIYEAEQTKGFFVLANGAPDGGELRQCRLVKDVVTTWVQYTKKDTGSGKDGYEIVDAWSHRMRFYDAE